MFVTFFAMYIHTRENSIKMYQCKGECADEFFLVTGGSSVPPICGLNSR